mgnify:CR=1 FL=1
MAREDRQVSPFQLIYRVRQKGSKMFLRIGIQKSANIQQKLGVNYFLIFGHKKIDGASGPASGFISAHLLSTPKRFVIFSDIWVPKFVNKFL